MNIFLSHTPHHTKKIIHNALEQDRHELLEPEAKQLIGAYGIITSRYAVASTVPEAVRAANSIKYPVVLKIVSPDISHKTDAGGIILNIQNDKEVEDAYEKILQNVNKTFLDARIHGILVEEMATPSTEIIVGGLRDPQFGPAVMFGLGGTFVELFKDVSFRIAPIEEYEALDMIHEVKGSKLLSGFRNAAPLDIPEICNIIIRVSDIMVSLEKIKEIDLNPILVYPKGTKTVDARIILTNKE
ncbi:MAG: acetyl-CoA synthetase [Candidatus Kuenenia sp.]|nr:acetyl-CoA synthetase [Candidatus Kuenenia hertensis]